MLFIMAHYYSCTDNWLSKRAFLPSIILFFGTFVSIIMVVYMYRRAVLESSAIGMLFVIATVVFLFKSTASFIKIVKKECPSYFKGWIGENRVGKILKNLPDDYHVFFDVKFDDGNKGNIDYVVIGTPGIFTIEVKYYKRSWARFYQHKKNKRQANNEAKRIYKYFTKLGLDIPWVQSLLVRANTENITKIHDGKTDVLGHEDLNEYFINSLNQNNITVQMVISYVEALKKELKCKKETKSSVSV